MNKKSWFICAIAFIAGLAIGALGVRLFFEKRIASGLNSIQEAQLSEAEHAAFAAYLRESRPVAIYASENALAKLEDAQAGFGVNRSLMTNSAMRFRIMITHARLGKLLAEDGQMKRSSNHIAKALHYAILAGDEFSFITNQETLFDALTNWDQKNLP